MSGIISSFFIEPVVRHARRFSASVQQRDRDAASLQAPKAVPAAPNELTLSKGRQDHPFASHQSPAPASASALHPLSQAIDSAQAELAASSPSASERPARAPSLDESPPAACVARDNDFLGHAAFDRFVSLTAVDPTSGTSRLVTSRQTAGAAPMVPASPIHEHSSTMANDRSIAYLPTTPMQSDMRDQAPSPSSSPSTRLRSGHSISRRHSNRTASQTDTAKHTPLPADDGYRLLRQRMHAIRDMEATMEEKAQHMHALMNETYLSSRVHLRPTSPDSIRTPERPRSSGSVLSIGSTNPTTPGRFPPPTCPPEFDPLNIYNICEEDLIPSYRPIPSPENIDDGPESLGEDLGSPEPELGCVHYKRKVKVQCWDCKLWYPCRHCHDAAQESHVLNRPATENMLCMACQTPQPASQDCRRCGTRAACYYCDECKFWEDDATKRVYHCSDCGICRQGEGLGKDFIHCKKCNVCIAVSTFKNHRCLEKATMCDCPICGEYMFHSNTALASLNCGHYLHQACCNQYMAEAYQCPVCKVSAKNMQLEWRKLDVLIEQQPMPAQWKDTLVEIRCNDCRLKSRVSYHWIGNKCALCDGYNTVEMQLLRPDQQRVDPQTVRAQELRNSFERRRVQMLSARPPARSYFHDPDEDQAHDPLLSRGIGIGIPGEGGFQLGLTALDVLARMSRSLSPIRHYFDSDDDSRRARSNSDSTGNGETSSSWDEVEDDDDDESESESNMTDMDEEEDEEDEEEGRGLDLHLIGHR